VRIDDTQNDKQLSHVGLALTDDEARELRDTLDILLGDPSARHEHVASADGSRELTVWLDRD
jgi:hypothetical protein